MRNKGNKQQQGAVIYDLPINNKQQQDIKHTLTLLMDILTINVFDSSSN